MFFSIRTENSIIHWPQSDVAASYVEENDEANKPNGNDPTTRQRLKAVNRFPDATMCIACARAVSLGERETITTENEAKEKGREVQKTVILRR